MHRFRKIRSTRRGSSNEKEKNHKFLWIEEMQRAKSLHYICFRSVIACTKDSPRQWVKNCVGLPSSAIICINPFGREAFPLNGMRSAANCGVDGVNVCLVKASVFGPNVGINSPTLRRNLRHTKTESRMIQFSAVSDFSLISGPFYYLLHK